MTASRPTSRPPLPVTRDRADIQLTKDVIDHLDVQLVSARRLLAVVLHQGKAIRVRDVKEVVRTAGLLQVEMLRRQAIETERAALLARAAVRLGNTAPGVTLELLTGLMDPEGAAGARERSAQLRGLLSEIQREHAINRALMSQELAFLDHLLRLADSDTAISYGSGGDRRFEQSTAPAGRRRVLDMHA